MSHVVRNTVVFRNHEGKVADGAAVLLLGAALPDRYGVQLFIVTMLKKGVWCHLYG